MVEADQAWIYSVSVISDRLVTNVNSTRRESTGRAEWSLGSLIPKKETKNDANSYILQYMRSSSGKRVRCMLVFLDRGCGERSAKLAFHVFLVGWGKECKPEVRESTHASWGVDPLAAYPLRAS